MTGTIRVVVQCDDFGMSHSGNAGAVQAFSDGILTQASVMVACPWFHEAAHLAKEHAIPVGVHLMLTSEWEYYRWGPVTGGRTLVAADGRFHRWMDAVREHADPDEILAEFEAQAELFLAVGLEITYFDCHVAVAERGPYIEMCRRYGKPFIYPIGEVAVGFDSIFDMSKGPSATKTADLLDWIAKVGPGTHAIVTHCAVDSDELRSMTSERDPDRDWANEYRPADLAALTSSEVRAAISARAIELTSVRDL